MSLAGSIPWGHRVRNDQACMQPLPAIPKQCISIAANEGYKPSKYLDANFNAHAYVSKQRRIKEGNTLFRDLGLAFLAGLGCWQGRIHHSQRKWAGKNASLFKCSKSTSGGSGNYSLWCKAMNRIKIQIWLHHKVYLDSKATLLLCLSPQHHPTLCPQFSMYSTLTSGTK